MCFFFVLFDNKQHSTRGGGLSNALFGNSSSTNDASVRTGLGEEDTALVVLDGPVVLVDVLLDLIK